MAADGRVDWLAVPQADVPPVCAALLDPVEGGTVWLEPTVDYEVEQRYIEDTMVLTTTFRCAQGEVRVTDALNRTGSGVLPWRELTRRIEASGAVPMRWGIQLGHRLSTERPWAEEHDGVVFLHVGTVDLAVVTNGVGIPRLQGAAVTGEFTTEEGSAALLALVANEHQPLDVPPAASVQHRLDETIGFWRRWSHEIEYDGPHAEEVRRSALVLKGLTLGPTKGQLAALTTSLQEKVGDKRNFDYRFGWVRDASFALDALSRLGLSAEVQGSLSWLLNAVRDTAPEVRAMYTIGGEPAPAEMSSLDWLPGYRDSQPVHRGNGAASQLQLGAYGDLMDAVWRVLRRQRPTRRGQRPLPRPGRRPGLRAVALGRLRVLGALCTRALHQLQAGLLGRSGPCGAPGRAGTDAEPAAEPVAHRAGRRTRLDR